jgi:magnesium-transporting ATPase (P-type)
MIEPAAVVSGLLQHWAELAIILTMLFVNAGVGFWQEYKADNTISLLKQRYPDSAFAGAETTKTAKRGGRLQLASLSAQKPK